MEDWLADDFAPPLVDAEALFYEVTGTVTVTPEPFPPAAPFPALSAAVDWLAWSPGALPVCAGCCPFLLVKVIS